MDTPNLRKPTQHSAGQEKSQRIPQGDERLPETSTAALVDQHLAAHYAQRLQLIAMHNRITADFSLPKRDQPYYRKKRLLDTLDTLIKQLDLIDPASPERELFASYLSRMRAWMLNAPDVPTSPKLAELPTPHLTLDEFRDIAQHLLLQADESSAQSWLSVLLRELGARGFQLHAAGSRLTEIEREITACVDEFIGSMKLPGDRTRAIDRLEKIHRKFHRALDRQDGVPLIPNTHQRAILVEQTTHRIDGLKRAIERQPSMLPLLRDKNIFEAYLWQVLSTVGS